MIKASLVLYDQIFKYMQKFKELNTYTSIYVYYKDKERKKCEMGFWILHVLHICSREDSIVACTWHVQKSGDVERKREGGIMYYIASHQFQ